MFKGSIVAIITPFKNGKLNASILSKQMGNVSPEEFTRQYNKLQELGIVNTSVMGGEWQALMKLNTNISIENIVTIATIICAVTLAFGFMQYDIDIMKKELELKADKREMVADRNLITYKLDVMMEDIAEIKQILKENK